MRLVKCLFIALGLLSSASCSLWSDEAALMVKPEIKQPLKQPISALVNHIIFFDFDSSVPPAGAERMLRPHIKYLIQHPQSILLIEGAADDTGTNAYNYQLGKIRAMAIEQLFIQEGIATEQLLVRSIGLNRPLNTADTKQSFARNRRVSLVY